MLSSPAEQQALRDTVDLEAALATVETLIAQLGQALSEHDPAATETASAALHRALGQAVDRATRAARHGGMPPALRRRLAACGGQVAALREAVARASVSLDKALEILLPGAGTARANVYGADGQAARTSTGGIAQA